MRRRIALTALVALALASVPAVAVAGKGGNGGGLSYTISMGGDGARLQAGSDMNFYVTRSVADNDIAAWVSNLCWDAKGNKVVDQDNAVRWGMWDSLDGESGAMPTGGTHCKAYVTLRPWQDRPYGDAILEYDISG